MIEIVTDWYCPNCGLEDRIGRDVPNRFHNCPKLHGMTAPLLKAGVSAKVEARLREDYVNGELVQKDDTGRPVMSVVTTRDNGMDAMVFAPVATGSVKDVS